MNPLLEHALVAAIIFGALGYLFSRFIQRRRAAGKGCGSDCGCGAQAKAPLTKEGGRL